MNIVTHRLIFNKYRGPIHYRQRPAGRGANQLGRRFKDTGLRPWNFVCMHEGNISIAIATPTVDRLASLEVAADALPACTWRHGLDRLWMENKFLAQWIWA